jgi:acyl-CoA synthetase (AMP-forming)/AMP-acid ligase II
MKMLKTGVFPSLHYTLFCGEPLHTTLAEKCQDAAPNAIVENLYGPTEATVAISHYRWNREESQSKSLNGIVPLGSIFGSHKSCIIDDDLKPVEAGSSGELCLAGPQVTNGYLNSPEKTRSNFVKIPELGGDTWYRTGDLVMRKDNCLHYLGRKDNQVKILGHRVELQEIDYILRRASGTDMAISVPLSVDYGNIGGIAAFIYGDRSNDESSIMSYCRKYLPDYMIPQKVYFIDNMPLNSNGKIDRLKLIEKVKG